MLVQFKPCLKRLRLCLTLKFERTHSMKARLLTGMLGLFLVAPVFLSGCSSTPSRENAAFEQDREVYSKYAENELRDWQKKAAKMKTSRVNDLKARLADARVELNRMELAGDATWREHKVQFESRMNQIETEFGSAE